MFFQKPASTPGKTRIRMAEDFSRITITKTDAGFTTYTVITQEGDVSRYHRRHAERHAFKTVYPQGSSLRMDIIEETDRLLARRGLHVKRGIFTLPQMKDDCRCCALP